MMVFHVLNVKINHRNVSFVVNWDQIELELIHIVIIVYRNLELHWTNYDIDGKGLVASLLVEMKLDNPRFNESTFWEHVEYWRKLHGGE